MNCTAAVMPSCSGYLAKLRGTHRNNDRGDRSNVFPIIGNLQPRPACLSIGGRVACMGGSMSGQDMLPHAFASPHRVEIFYTKP